MIKSLNIFKPGKHTAMNGLSLDFSEDQLRRSAEAYDTSIHEAPLTVGHPRDNLPAYGWVKSLSFAENGIEADPYQVDADFAEMVNAGRFKKISASWYLPDSPSNPVPGVYYLRHVGFLGAQPPAVKGLRDAAFSEDEEGIVEFVEPYSTNIIATMMRRLRDWIISKDGIEAADKALPDFLVGDLEEEARRPADSEPNPTFSEPQGEEMTREELAAQQAKLDKQKADQDAQAASFAEREQRIAEREARIKRDAVAVEIDKFIGAGKVPAAKKDALVAFMCGLDDSTVIEFGEGDKAVKQSPMDFMRSFLGEIKPAVSFGEESGEDGAGDNGGLTAEQIKDKALEYQEAKKSKGIAVSYVDAVNAVTAA
ncbi:MAG: peptidase [Anaerolineae bacterium]|nr:peptidase [Anaerolineae bacterium]